MTSDKRARSFATSLLRDARALFLSRELLFCILLGIWIASAIITTSMFTYGMRHTTTFRYGIVLCMLILDLATNRHWYVNYRFRLTQVFFLAAILLFAFAGLKTRDYWLPQLLCIAFCARDIDTAKLFKAWLYGSILAIVAIMGSCAIGLIPDFLVSQRGLFGRHSLGFTYTTFLSHYYLGIVAAVVYLRRNNPSLPSALLLFFGNLAIYFATSSRNSFLLCCIVLLVYAATAVMFRSNKRPISLMSFVLKYSYIIFLILSAVLLFAFDPNSGIGAFLNKLISNRISLTQQAFDLYPVSIFGERIFWSTNYLLSDGTVATGYYDEGRSFVAGTYLYVDCAYFKILLSNGPIVLAFSIVLLTALSIHSVRTGDYALAFLMLIFAMKAVLDPQLLSLHYCPLLLLLAKPWFMERVNTWSGVLPGSVFSRVFVENKTAIGVPAPELCATMQSKLLHII